MPFVAAMLELLSGAPANYWLSFTAFWRAAVLGLAMPALAGIIPIRRALQNTVAGIVSFYSFIQQQISV